MDPTEWPLLIKLIAGWGPLGVWAAYAELRASRAQRDHHTTRTAHEKSIKEITEAQREADAEKDAEHRLATEKLTDRFVRLIEHQSRVTNRLADGVDKKTKKRKGAPDEQGDQEGSDGDPGAS